MANLAVGEQLLDDQRLNRVASRLTVEFPALLDFNPDFVTWIQEPMEAMTDDGLARKIPRVAVLAVITDNPRQPNTKLLSKGAMLFEHWHDEDKSRDASGNDPALKLYRPILRSHLDQLQNLKELMD